MAFYLDSFSFLGILHVPKIHRPTFSTINRDFVWSFLWLYLSDEYVPKFFFCLMNTHSTRCSSAFIVCSPQVLPYEVTVYILFTTYSYQISPCDSKFIDHQAFITFSYYKMVHTTLHGFILYSKTVFLHISTIRLTNIIFLRILTSAGNYSGIGTYALR
jgi:hypothetical protein